jgi:hypothetical protein
MRARRASTPFAFQQNRRQGQRLANERDDRNNEQRSGFSAAVKWEYLARNFNELGTMSAEGEQGWELVAVVQQVPAHSGVVAYFKRPKN